MSSDNVSQEWSDRPTESRMDLWPLRLQEQGRQGAGARDQARTRQGAIDIRDGRRTLFQLPIHDLLEPAQCANRPVVVERQQLHHVHGADVLHRIDPELGVMMPAQLRLPGLRKPFVAGSLAAIWNPRPNLSLPAPSGYGLVRCLSASG